MIEGGSRLISLLDALRSVNPDKSVAYTAIQGLASPELMIQFFFEYANSLKTSQDPDAREHPYDAAATKISQMTRFFSPEDAQRWHKLLQTGSATGQPKRFRNTFPGII